MNAENVNIAFAVVACSILYTIYIGSKSLSSRIASLELDNASLKSDNASFKSDNASFKSKLDSIWKITTIPQILNCAAQILLWVIAQQPKKHSSNAFGESFGNYTILESVSSILFDKSVQRFQAKARRIVDHRNTTHHACSLDDLDDMVAIHLEIIRTYGTEIDTMIRPAKLSQRAKALRDAVITIQKYELIKTLLSEKRVRHPSAVSDTTDSQEVDDAYDTEVSFPS